MLTKATAENAHALNLKIASLCKRIRNENNKDIVGLFERTSLSFSMNVFKVCRIAKISEVLRYTVNALEDLCEMEYFLKYFRDLRVIPEEHVRLILDDTSILRKTISRAIKLALLK